MNPETPVDPLIDDLKIYDEITAEYGESDYNDADDQKDGVENDDAKTPEDQNTQGVITKTRQYRTIEDMQKLAVSRGGLCLSTEFNNIGINLTWRCCDGHTWDATPRNVIHKKSWCPICRGNIGEELVRAAMVEAFSGKSFERTRKCTWLNGLELDGYNEELKLAFEYQGLQHFKLVPHFQTQEMFESQLARDILKRELCTNAKVTLLEIPYTVNMNYIRQHVRKMLTDLGLAISDMSMSTEDFYNTVRSISRGEKFLKRAKEIAIAKGGVCIATKYISNTTLMPFICGKGHSFNATFQGISQPESRGPRFCDVCGGTKKKEDEEIRKNVEKIGYTYFSTEMRKVGKRIRKYITVQCPLGHPPYPVEMSNLIDGNGLLKKGCSVCGHIRTGAAKKVNMHTLEDEGGLRPIDEYKTKSVVQEWQCARGHVFNGRLDSLRGKKNPCSTCWLMDYAEKHEFEILSGLHGDIKIGDKVQLRCLKCKTFVIEKSRASASKKNITCDICK